MLMLELCLLINFNAIEIDIIKVVIAPIAIHKGPGFIPDNTFTDNANASKAADIFINDFSIPSIYSILFTESITCKNTINPNINAAYPSIALFNCSGSIPANCLKAMDTIIIVNAVDNIIFLNLDNDDSSIFVSDKYFIAFNKITIIPKIAINIVIPLCKFSLLIELITANANDIFNNALENKLINELICINRLLYLISLENSPPILTASLLNVVTDFDIFVIIIANIPTTAANAIKIVAALYIASVFNPANNIIDAENFNKALANDSKISILNLNAKESIKPVIESATTDIGLNIDIINHIVLYKVTPIKAKTPKAAITPNICFSAEVNSLALPLNTFINMSAIYCIANPIFFNADPKIVNTNSAIDNNPLTTSHKPSITKIKELNKLEKLPGFD